MQTRVLIVEPNKEKQAVLSNLMQAANITTDYADDLFAISRHADKDIDLILVADEGLGQSSYAFCQLLRRQSAFKNTLINLVTSAPERVDWGRAFVSRIDDICLFDDDGSELLNHVLRQIRKRRILRANSYEDPTSIYSGFSENGTIDFNHKPLSDPCLTIWTDRPDLAVFEHLSRLAQVRFQTDTGEIKRTSDGVHIFAYEKEPMPRIAQLAQLNHANQNIICLIANNNSQIALELLRFGVDEVVSDQINPWRLAAIARQYIENARFNTYQRAEISRRFERSQTDQTTGIFCKDYAQDFLNALKRRTPKSQLAAILFDIDHFKRINDQHGHLFGDQVLKSVARRLANTSRSMDVLSRFGGDEFLMLLPETEQNTAEEIARRMMMAVEQHPHTKRNITVQISYGVASTSADDPQLLGAADQALLSHKRQKAEKPIRA